MIATDTPNSFTHTYRKRLAAAEKPFLARGANAKRCPNCFLAEFACMCQWRARLTIDIDIVLLMHPDEILKPTNTGRLAADLFADNVLVFEWSRVNPSLAMLEALRRPDTDYLVLFPPREGDSKPVVHGVALESARNNLTLVVLDGTWKQAGKMYRQSPYLANFPLLSIHSSVGDYTLRSARDGEQLSTAEAVAYGLSACHQLSQSQALFDLFAVFNHHYVCTRRCVSPSALEAHSRLMLLNNCTSLQNRPKK